MAGVPVLPALSRNRYNEIFKIYSRLNPRDAIFLEWIHRNIHLLTDAANGVSEDTELKLLSVGSGDGRVEGQIWSRLRDSVSHSKISATMVEPDTGSIQHFQDLVSEKADVQGIDFDWRCQTFQDYEKSNDASGDKFHIIACFSSLYYLGDLEMALENLYERLENGGIALIMVEKGDSGWGKLQKYLQTRLGTGALAEHCTAFEVQDACKRLNIPVSQVHTIPMSLDISACLKPPGDISEDGKALLDFMTNREDFVGRAPPDMRDDVLRFMSSECSERGPDGEFVMNQSAVTVIIRREF